MKAATISAALPLHDQIRVGREAKGWSVEDLAQRIIGRNGRTISRQAILYWEAGRYRPRAIYLKQLEILLQVRFDVTGSGVNLSGSPIPPGVTGPHLELAVRISRLPAPVRWALEAIIEVSAAQAEGKPLAPFLAFNTQGGGDRSPFEETTTHEPPIISSVEARHRASKKPPTGHHKTAGKAA